MFKLFGKKSQPETKTKEPYRGPLTINAKPPKKYTIKVAEGVSVAGINRRQDVVKRLIEGGGRQIILEREPDNPKDKNAIKVMGRWLDSERVENVEHIGYVPAETAKMIAENYPDNELKGCLMVIYQPQEDRAAGMRFNIYATPV